MNQKRLQRMLHVTRIDRHMIDRFRTVQLFPALPFTFGRIIRVKERLVSSLLTSSAWAGKHSLFLWKMKSDETSGEKLKSRWFLPMSSDELRRERERRLFLARLFIWKEILTHESGNWVQFSVRPWSASLLEENESSIAAMKNELGDQWHQRVEKEKRFAAKKKKNVHDRFDLETSADKLMSCREMRYYRWQLWNRI